MSKASSPHRRHGWRWLLAACLLVVALLVAAGQYFLRYALARNPETYNPELELTNMQRNYPWAAQWMDSIQRSGALCDTIIANPQGLRLHAWYVPAPRRTERTAVIVHGYHSNPIQMLQIGYLYHHDLQWNILLPDLQAHAQSEGETVGMGWPDRLDVAQWTRVAHEKFRSDTIVVHGISMGAATTMCLSGEETPAYVRAFVEDCGYTSVWDEFEGELRKQFHLPAFPLLHTTSLMNKLQNGWSFAEASPLQQVAKCRKPMLFIHGDADTFVPTSMLRPLFEAKPLPKAIWLAPGSAHADAYRDHPIEYAQRVKEFLSIYL